MLHNRQINNKIKHLHERCPSITHTDKLSFYEDNQSPEIDGLVSVYQRDTHGLATEMFHIKYDQSREIVADIFEQTTQ